MDINQIKNLIRIGTVSAVNGKSCCARVAFEDKDNMVSAELPIITIGSRQTKAYWLPEVGTQVLCIFQPNASGSGIGKGFVWVLFTARRIRRWRVKRTYAVSRLPMAALSGIKMGISRLMPKGT